MDLAHRRIAAQAKDFPLLRIDRMDRAAIAVGEQLVDRTKAPFGSGLFDAPMTAIDSGYRISINEGGSLILIRP